MADAGKHDDDDNHIIMSLNMYKIKVTKNYNSYDCSLGMKNLSWEKFGVQHFDT